MRNQSSFTQAQSRHTPHRLTPWAIYGCRRLERLRLEHRISAPAAAPVTILAASAGCGKSELLRTFRNDPRKLYFRVGQQFGTFARFVAGLAQAVAPLAPGASASFPRAWERALQSRSPGTVLAHWLCEHLAGADHPLAIDDLHDAAGDPNIAAFIAKLDELRPKSSLTVAVRSVGALPIAYWMATRRMERPIDEAELRFNDTEVAVFAEQLGLNLDRNEIVALLAATRGFPAGVAYALTQLSRDPRAFSNAAVPATFEEVASAVFARRSRRQRELLVTAALYPNIDDELLLQAGWLDASELWNAMSEDAPFMWEPDAAGSTRFHDRFGDYLMAQFASYDPRLRSTIAARAVDSLRRTGRYADALAVAARQRLTRAMRELLDEHGFGLLESGQVDVIGEALDTFDAAEQSLGAKVLALRGYLEARRGRPDTAEAYFCLGLKTAQDEASRVAIALYYTRELSVRRRADACDALAPFADSTTLARGVLIDVRSSFGQALAAAGRLDEARSRTDEAFAMLDAGVAPALRARVYARAAYVAIETGALSLARERALIAAPLAVAESLYDVAASTYSVLYNVAYRSDEVLASLDYLQRVRAMGVKSGTLRLELYALLGMYELHAEAGDERALAELAGQLAAVDKHDAGVEMMEALLPAKALQAAWAGDFEVAIDLVRPTAEQYATPERRALSWAQIGVYSAALNAAERMHGAIRTAQDNLGQVDVQTSVSELALLTLGLAAWAGGDVDAAREWMIAADRASTGRGPRLHALRNALASMTAGSLDSGGAVPGISDALAQLRAASFGGMARMIEALPYRHAGAGGVQTTGTVLAKDEFPARLDAAARGDASLLRAWLDALPASVVRELSIVAGFDRWAAGRQDVDPRRRERIRDLRREVAAYAPQAAAFIRLVDNVDASIGTLLEHLDVAAPLMAEHSRAVSAWCSRIARTLDLPEVQIVFVTRCGLIHDVGKMRIPSEILNAPRVLDAAEWPIMQDHAAEGARIVAETAELRPFIPVVRGHHERLDGKGYPDGLRSCEIPFAARIVAVADSFNAMIGRRSYRGAIAPSAALDQLECGRGSQFDPEIVTAMIRVVLGRPVDPATG